MDLKKIKKLMEMLADSPITHLQFEDEKHKIVLKKEQIPVPAIAVNSLPDMPNPGVLAEQIAAAAVPADDDNIIIAPLVGTVYLASAPGEKPFVEIGQELKAGDTVCLIEAMKMFNEVKADTDCLITEILVKDGALAEFGTPLFRIESKDD
jgi:acetyl-CoA carboxylase biotin carboxyl carrier protein